MKKILLLVTGMSPQIVTETLYGLAVRPINGIPWTPDEVHVVSTNDGLNQIRDRLFDKAHFQRLLQDYNLPSIHFNESCLHKICTEDGQVLSDLKTPEDNELAANTICEVIRNFTSSNENELHVSIAGGRKTMGFYAGYALSLYGRSQDRMSHVLVEEKFEKCNDVINGFYYPTPNTRLVFGKEGVSQDAKDAKEKIWLANIPFVRLRHHLPEKTLLHKAKFSEVVERIALATGDIRVVIDIKKQTLFVNSVPCKLAARELAFYVWFVKQLSTANLTLRMPVEGESIAEYRDAFLMEYKLIKGEMAATEAIESTLTKGMDKSFFEQRLTAVRKAFKETYGEEVAKRLAIINTKRGQSNYGLTLTAKQIEILN